MSDAAPITFVGWVPTIVGHRSLATIGETNHPTKSRVYRWWNPENTIVVVRQRRRLSDIPFKRLFNSRDDVWFVAIFRMPSASERDEPIHGEILCFSGREEWEDKGRQAVRKLRARFGSLATKHQLPASTRAQSDEIADSAQALIEFSLERTGRATLSLPPQAEPNKQGATGRLLRSAQAPTASPAPKADHRDPRILVSQGFFFLKDICHWHQHHDPSTDTLVDIHRKDEKNWANRTLEGLNRKIVQFKRVRKPSMLYDSLGVLSYTETFCKLFSSEISSKARIQFNNTNQIRASINTAIEARQALDSRITQRISRLAFFIGLFALVVATITLISITEHRVAIESWDQSSYKDVSIFIINNMPFLYVFGFTVISLALLYIFREKLPFVTKLLDEILRILFVFSKRQTDVIGLFQFVFVVTVLLGILSLAL